MPLQGEYAPSTSEWARTQAEAYEASGGREAATLRETDLPVIEIHITNVHQRESFRHHSYVSKVARGVLAGFGIQGYALAIEGLAGMIGAKER